MIKRVFLITTIMGLLAVIPAFASDLQNYARSTAGVQTESDGRDVRLPDGKKQIARLAKRLKLSSNQAKYVRAILADRDHRIEIIQGSEVLPEDAKDLRITETLCGSNEQIAAVLNSKQRKKFEALLARLREREQKDRERAAGDGLPALPPPGRRAEVGVSLSA